MILTFLFTQVLWSKEHIVETKSGKMIFTTSEAEISQRKFFGADLWFTGEKRKNKRNVMSILYNSGNIELDPHVSTKAYSKHKNQMKEFANKRGYSEVHFEPYSFVKINNKLSYHHFVWSYKKQDTLYKEQSYYVECGPLFFIAKATTFSDAKTDQKKFKNIIEGAKCLK